MLIPLIQLLISLCFSLVHTKQSLRSLSKSITIPIIYEENEDYYVIALGIGNPRTYFPVQIDTSTSTTWVPSSDCSNCHSLSQYTASNSSTSVAENKSYELWDEDGNIQGLLTYDDIELESLKINHFGFLRAMKLLEHFADHEDGKLGLGYHHELGHAMNFIEMLKKEGYIGKRIFSIKELNYTHGELFIGTAPMADYPRCNLTSPEDLDDEYKESWICHMSHVGFYSNENISDVQKPLFNQAIQVKSLVSFDSAASFITAPLSFIPMFEKELFNKDLLNHCYRVIENNHTIFRCNVTNNRIAYGQGMELHFFLDGYAYIISMTELFEEINDTTVEFFIHFRQENDPIWNFGHPFMRKFQVIFNAEDNHVGFIGLSNNYLDDWNNWLNGGKHSLFMKILMIGGIVLGFILLIVIIFFIYRACRKPNDSNKPLVNNEQRTY